MQNIKLALNICTYKREKEIKSNLDLLYTSSFFNSDDKEHYGRLHIFVVDNASELDFDEHEFIHVIKNRNTGGSGGFQRGIEEIRKYDDFSHVIFMDDDVTFELSCFYILFDFLRNVEGEDALRPVAGRMFDKDNPSVQYTSAEIWNGGDIKHVEFMRDISDGSYTPGKVIYESGAEYGGFWFCCYPMSFVRGNDIKPFFLHCDDVEYGLRTGKSPIIIEGVQVWHETWDKKFSPVIVYYDTRNPLFVNEMFGMVADKKEIKKLREERMLFYHYRKDYLSEYMVYLGVRDYFKGKDWLWNLDGEENHKKIQKNRGLKKCLAFVWGNCRRVVNKVKKCQKDM